MKRRIRDVDLAYDDRGDGLSVVVLLHPFPFDRRIWAGNIPALLGSGGIGGRRVIALDCPGFGESPLPGEQHGQQQSPPFTIASIADLVAGLLDELGIARATLVGESMGGYVALAFAAAHADRLDALVLADTRAAADGDAARAGREQALATLREQGADAYLDGSLPRLLAPDARPELLALARSLAERRPETLAAGIAALRDRPDRSAELPRLGCPTLVLVGAGDQVTPPAEMRAMAAAIPSARFVELPGAGHLSNLEAPEAFNHALAALQMEASAR